MPLIPVAISRATRNSGVIDPLVFVDEDALHIFYALLEYLYGNASRFRVISEHIHII
jgi:hypothetical protein